jgi:glycosyltransferase 2 family protein
VVFPNGIGVRELILIAALAPVLDRPAALALALLARAATTLSDLAWGGIGLAIGRRASTAVAQAADRAAEPAVGRGYLEPDARGTS